MDVLRVSDRRRRGTAIVAAEGELDLHEAPYFSERLRAVCDDNDGPVTVDFSGLRFVDSAGLATLLNVARRMTRARRSFNLVSPAGSDVRRVLELTRLEDTLRVRESVDDALDDHASRLSSAGGDVG